MNYGFVIDNRKCIGCHACTVACKSEHDVPIGVNRTWVKYIEKGEFPNTRRVFSVMRCNHCEDAPCVEICPVGALFIREDGIVDFNRERCIGCKSCTQACPYNSIYIDPDTDTAAKCNFCAHRVDMGLRPACVNVCPEQAIIQGDLDDPNSEITKLLSRQQVQARKVEKGTVPKLYYIDGDAASLNPLAAPPTNQMVQTHQAAGVGHYAKYAKKRMNGPVGDDTSAAAPYEKESPEDYGVTIPTGGDVETYTKKAWSVVKENVRRTHDAPQKGIMWGWELPAYLWSKSISAGAFFVMAMAALFGLAPVSSGLAMVGSIGSLAFLVLTAVFLIKDLDRPDRFHYVILRPQASSWLVKGGNFLSLFGGLAAVLLAGVLFDMEILQTIGLWGGMIFAVPLAGYTAFLLAQAKGRDFWQSPVLPLHMLVHSAMAGAGFFAIYGLVSPLNVAWDSLVQMILVGAIGMNLLILLAELSMPHPTADAKLTAKMIYNGEFSSLFYGVSVLIGNLIPLALAFTGSGIALGVAGVLVMIGIYVTEKIWVKAPQLIPLS